MKLDWSSGALAQGLACYGSARYFQAHEHWETVWLVIGEPEKSFLQALIQIAAAFHHLQAGNRAGAISLLGKAHRRLSICAPVFGGIAISPLRAAIAQCLTALESGAPAPRIPQIMPIDLADELSAWPEPPSTQR
jgi:hypothetical protein